MKTQSLIAAYRPLLLRGTLVEGRWPPRSAAPAPATRSPRPLRMLLAALLAGRRAP